MKNKNKSIIDLSVDDLLEELESLPEESGINLKETSNDVPSFLLHFGIKPGNEVVTHRLLFELYKLWSTKPLTKSVFEHSVGKYILKHTKGAKVFFLIDKSSFKLTEEIQKHIEAKTRDGTKIRSYKRHFENFLKKYNLKKGTCFLEHSLLYWLYSKWTYSINKKNPLGSNQFFNYCKLYFDFKRNSVSRMMWFGVDKQELTKIISWDELERIRRYREIRNDKKYKEKKSKKYK